MFSKPAPRFDNDPWNPRMLCPSCGSEYLHHDAIEIFDRKEDDEHGLHVLVERGKVTMDNSMAGNPSSRRHGLRIGFWCENCEFRTILTMQQHKGVTIVNTELVKGEGNAKPSEFD